MATPKDTVEGLLKALAEERAAGEARLAEERAAGEARLAEERAAGEARLAKERGARVAAEARLAEERAAGDARMVAGEARLAEERIRTDFILRDAVQTLIACGRCVDAWVLYKRYARTTALTFNNWLATPQLANRGARRHLFSRRPQGLHPRQRASRR